MRNRAKHLPHPQAGFTLLEVLIALLILSFGLIGISLLQVKSLHGVHHAYLGSVANMAARDVKEQLWAKKIEMLRDTPVDATLCPAADASKLEVSGWTNKLPDGEILVTSLETPCEYVVEVRWIDSRLNTDEVQGAYTTYQYYVSIPTASPITVDE
ncbi:prepilin-type N-terminal cleavage/methylation domain-containing protein [Halomonas sp.]|uniref:type IV pilus modification PilV family protein n=1 Tax=Halomonas sp. TaxID=1486246 RepID=UPI003850E17C